MIGLVWFGLMLLAAEPERPIDFDTEIVPVLTRSGCNAGACHGAAAGRGGLHLSLLGADPAADHEAIAHAFEGRRINWVHPRKSLLLRKPTGHLDHGGGMLLDADSPGAERIVRWIQEGALRTSPRRLSAFEVSPRRARLATIPAEVTLEATARFDEGRPEDVTAWTIFQSADPSAVTIGDDHRARIHRRGQHLILARFLHRVEPMVLVVPWAAPDAARSDAARTDAARTDAATSERVPVDDSDSSPEEVIDRHVMRLLDELRIPASPPATDTEWLRRVTLDLTGRLPDPTLVALFLQTDGGSRREKRERMVDRLLSSDAFVDFWTLRFSRLLQMHSLPNEQQGLAAYAGWLRSGISGGTGWDEMARQLLTATGDSHVIGPANFGRMAADPRAHAELVGRFFLGMRLGCANCHNHPLDKWTQDDYHGLAAIFARLERGRIVELSARGSVTNLRTGEPAVPRIPGLRDLPADGDHREAVFQWAVTGPNNYFARATVNRLWRAMFGRGLIEPPDDLRDTNPATHPELLEWLAADFAKHRFQIRHALRGIALSDTYARSATPLDNNGPDDQFYSHALRRPLDPEVLVDAIADVTGVAETFGDGVYSRAVAVIDPLFPAPTLDTLGRCNRAAACEETLVRNATLPARLHLLNSALINAKLASDLGRLHLRIAAGCTTEEIVNEFYLHGLSRRATVDERSAWLEELEVTDRDERRRRLEDFVWSLLNSRQFAENH